MVPESLEGCRILDLGSGSGRDCYMLSQLVGETGHVTGIDMTEDQVGNEHCQYTVVIIPPLLLSISQKIWILIYNIQICVCRVL